MTSMLLHRLELSKPSYQELNKSTPYSMARIYQTDISGSNYFKPSIKARLTNKPPATSIVHDGHHLYEPAK